MLATNSVFVDTSGWAVLESYHDKAWSLVDATRFAIMRQRGITEAFTTDHHFVQAGFILVPTQ